LSSLPIAPIDCAILALYLIAITLFGARFRRKQQTLRDYFLGGRTAPWWAIMCSIVATETSTLTIISTPGIAYGGNLGFLQLVIGYLVARVILCVVLVPQYFRGEFYTAYQLLEKRFGSRMKSAAAVVFLATRALAEGVRISAIGKVVSVAFGTGTSISILIITVLTIFYTFEGGMQAVIWTDVIQFVLYLSGSVAAFFLLFHKIPGGWPEITQVAAAAGGKFTIFNFSVSLTQSYTFWSGLLGGTFLTMASHGTDQTMVQRLLSARNERDSKKALLASGIVVLFQFTLFLVIGVMLYVFAQHTPLIPAGGDPDKIYPSFVVHHLPVGITGIILASIFAIAMSNASGSLNSLASSSIIDLSKRPGEKAARSVLRSRWTTALWGVVLGALGLIKWGPALVAGLTIASITYGGLLGVFLLGSWNKKANQTGALIGFAAGIATMIVVRLETPLAWTWYVLAGTLVTFAIGSLASAVSNGTATASNNDATHAAV
jgi:solute:Na+ symporter, SSS family